MKLEYSASASMGYLMNLRQRACQLIFKVNQVGNFFIFIYLFIFLFFKCSGTFKKVLTDQLELLGAPSSPAEARLKGGDS